MVGNKVECPQCLGTKQYLKSVGSHKKRRRKMSDCDLCDDNGKVDIDIADDFITSKVVVYGTDND